MNAHKPPPQKITFKEEHMLSAQHYYDDPIRKITKNEFHRSIRDWSSAQVKQYIGSDPIFTFGCKFYNHVEKLHNEDEFLFWNKANGVICLFSSQGRKYYQQPKDMNAVTLVRVGQSLYLFAMIKDTLNVCNLSKNSNKMIQFKQDPKLGDLDEREIRYSIINPTNNEEEKYEGGVDESQEYGKNDYFKEVILLDFVPVMQLRKCHTLISKENKIFTLNSEGEVNLLEVTEKADGSVSLDSLSYLKIPFQVYVCTYDFINHLVFAQVRRNMKNHLLVYRLKKGLMNPQVLYHSRMRFNFFWNNKARMLFVDSRWLYRLNKLKFVLVRTIEKTIERQDNGSLLLTKKGFLQENKDGLYFYPYFYSNNPVRIDLPQDRKAVLKADYLGEKALEWSFYQQAKGRYRYYKRGEGDFAGPSIEALEFLNQEGESFILVGMRNHFIRKFTYADLLKDKTGGHVEAELDSFVKSFRIFKIE